MGVDKIDRYKTNELTIVQIFGLSAYCATPNGVHLISNKWGWQEIGYISDEYVVTSPSKSVAVKSILCMLISRQLIVLTGTDMSPKEAEEYKKQNYSLHRCVFVGTTKNSPSIVWQFIRNPLSKL